MDTSTSISAEGEPASASATTKVREFGKNDDSGFSSQIIEVPSCNGENTEKESQVNEETVNAKNATTLETSEQQSEINLETVGNESVNDGTSIVEVTQVTDVTDDVGNASGLNNNAEQPTIRIQRKQVSINFRGSEENIITLSSDSEVEYEEDSSRSYEEEDGEEEVDEDELEDESVGGIMYPHQLSSSISISLVGSDGAQKKPGVRVTEVISLSSDNDSDVEESRTSVIKSTSRDFITENFNKEPEPVESMVVELESGKNSEVGKPDENQMDPLDKSSDRRSPSKCSLPPTPQAQSDLDEPDVKKIKTDEGSTNKYSDSTSTYCGSEPNSTNCTVSQISDRKEEQECGLTFPTPVSTASNSSGYSGTQLKELDTTTPRTSQMKKYKSTAESLSPAKKPQQQSSQNVGKTKTHDETDEFTKSQLQSLNKLEANILAGAELIKRKSEEEVDLSDDENSSFVQMEVLEKSYWDTLQRATQSIKVVGAKSPRKKIRISTATVSGHSEIQQELEALISKRNWELTSDLHSDILGVVKKVASQKSLIIDAEAMAERVCQYLSKKFKLNRKEEFDISWPASSSDDPALKSPELAAKLAENKKLRKEIPLELARRPGAENPNSPTSIVIDEQELPECESDSTVTDDLRTKANPLE